MKRTVGRFLGVFCSGLLYQLQQRMKVAGNTARFGGTKVCQLVFPVSLLAVSISLAQVPTGKGWKKQVVSRDFLSEGLSAGDLDGDGVVDLLAGAFWFKGPDFREVVNYRPGHALPVKSFMEDSFLSWVDDLNGDGRNDILMVGHPGRELTIYLNPGNGGDWPSYQVMKEVATESPLWIDLFGDGKKELVCMQGGKFGYAEVDWSDVTRPWKFIPISESVTKSPYVHGLGVGDLNGDGRLDIVEKSGWFEQPATKDGVWVEHKELFAEHGGAQMLVFDVDGDGDNDVITSINSHGYGLAWFENRTVEGKTTFFRHEILPEDPAASGPGGVQFSQLHAFASGDFDNDGRKDFITGKRYYAHNGKDPGAEDPALAVIFYNRKDGNGVRWEPEVIDADSGVGCQVLAVDLDGDGKLEFAAASKKGVNVISRK